MATIFFDIALAFVVVGTVLAVWRVLRHTFAYDEIIGKYRVYKIVKELEKRKIKLSDIDEYLRINLDGKRRKERTIKEIDQEVKEEFEGEKGEK